MHQPKDIDWLGGYKNKSHMYVVYKRPTSDTYRLKVRDGRWYFMQMEIIRKLEWQYSYRKIDFKTKTAIRDK